MSRHAVDGRLDLMRHDLDRGMRLSAVLLIPAALGLVVLGQPVAVALFAHGRTTVAQADQIGSVLAVFALGLLPFSIYQLQSRAFYARSDTKTPALIQVLVSTTLVLVDVAASLTLPAHTRIYGLAVGLVIANWVGVAVTTTLLRRQLGSSRATRTEDHGGTAHSTIGALVRMTAAGLAGAATAALAAATLTPHLPTDWTGAAIVVAVASAADVVIYAAVLLLLGVDEAKWPWRPRGAATTQQNGPPF
jgi:putative peptidoglycan lipid II flippase